MSQNSDGQKPVQQIYLDEFAKLDALLTRLDEALVAADDKLAGSLIQEIEPIVTRLDAMHQTVVVLPDCQSSVDRSQ